MASGFNMACKLIMKRYGPQSIHLKDWLQCSLQSSGCSPQKPETNGRAMPTRLYILTISPAQLPYNSLHLKAPWEAPSGAAPMQTLSHPIPLNGESLR